MIHDSNYNDDEVHSDDFSDFDQPYHETASDWFRRSARRRARRLAGVSSCSSSDESIEEGYGDGEMTTPSNNNAAFKPIIKWQRQYPIAAARACLSLSQSDTAIGHGSTRSPRERECNKLYRVFNKLRRQQSMQHQQQQQNNDDDNTQAIENDKLVIDSFLPRGTGISFIDSVLAREIRRQGTSSCSLVCEMTGSRRSGKTTTLVAIAARYVASTTNSFFYDLLECEAKSTATGEVGDLNQRPSKRQRRHGKNSQSSQSVIEPRVVILDIDHCVNPIKLMLTVREAVLRRFHETSAARKWVRELKANNNAQGGNARGTTNMEEDPEAQLYDELSAREKKMIERTITSCLGRINIVQPRDFTYLSLVATLEGLRQSLDHEKKDNNQKQAPTLIMVDSMSTLDSSTQFQESLPAAKGSYSGLSDRNEFFRQLIRLRDAHEVAIIGTSLTTAGRCRIWEKIVTHRVSIEKGMN
mmetsp:Transcript_6624/g.10106  ORF Transcript_6624/g.10106 Transcript_6624/m.10106 type:complete len:470 (+) Transcript_6624:59-1468(+)|eukprot:scaffold913_cov137-Skeletonema_dohrnii-CCMP3373.AAC.21